MSSETKAVAAVGAKGLLATAVAMAAGTGAYGAEVRFENDAGFAWPFAVLDLTQSSASQPAGGLGSEAGSSVYLNYFADFYPAFTYYHHYTTTTGNGAAVWSAGFDNRYAQAFAAGEAIGSTLAGGLWRQGSTLEFAFNDNNGAGNRGLLPTDGADTYIGVQLSIGGSYHYGWVGVRNQLQFIDVFAWGYNDAAGEESRAGGVPEPGTGVVLLALGAVGALRRHRKPGRASNTGPSA